MKQSIILSLCLLSIGSCVASSEELAALPPDEVRLVKPLQALGARAAAVKPESLEPLRDKFYKVFGEKSHKAKESTPNDGKEEKPKLITFDKDTPATNLPADVTTFLTTHNPVYIYALICREGHADLTLCKGIRDILIAEYQKKIAHSTRDLYGKRGYPCWPEKR